MEASALKGLVHCKVEQIIVEVQQHQFLWDRGVVDYKDVELKETTWGQIADTVQLPVERVKKVWSSLRDTYTRYTRFDNKAVQDGRAPPRRGKTEQWRWAKAMEFYAAEYMPRRSTISSSNVGQISEIQLKGEISDSEGGTDEYGATSWNFNQSDPADDIQDIPDAATNQIATPVTLKRKRAVTPPDEENFYIVQSREEEHDGYTSKDEVADRQWLLSLLPNFKGMTLQQKNLLKYKIQGLFVEVEAGVGVQQQPTQSHFR